MVVNRVNDHGQARSVFVSTVQQPEVKSLSPKTVTVADLGV